MNTLEIYLTLSVTNFLGGPRLGGHWSGTAPSKQLSLHPYESARRRLERSI
jgi:hypothetical protein